MDNIFKCNFWFWSHKLKGILSMLAFLSDYTLDDIEFDIICSEIIGTNDEKDMNYSYFFNGKKYRIDFFLCFDENEGTDMIHMTIITSPLLKEKIEMLILFQSMFLELKLEN